MTAMHLTQLYFNAHVINFIPKLSVFVSLFFIHPYQNSVSIITNTNKCSFKKCPSFSPRRQIKPTYFLLICLCVNNERFSFDFLFFFSNFKSKVRFAKSEFNTQKHVYTVICNILNHLHPEFCFNRFISAFLYSLKSEKQPLPPGVTQKDADLFKEIQDKGAEAVTEIMNANGGHVNLAVSQGTALNASLLSSSSIAMAAQVRCPSAIEFGQWHIETWYSSPFPQEYAR